MNLHQLEYFVAVGEHLSFTKAAQQCGITQTAISQQIKALEEKLEVRLLKRDRHHVELTPAGAAYIGEARAILLHAERAAKIARVAQNSAEGSLRIAFMRGCEQDYFSEIVRSFRELAPKVDISLMRENMGAVYEALENSACDVAFSLAPFTQDYPGLSFRFIKSYPIMAVLYPGHRLADRESILYTDLRNESFIIQQEKDRPVNENEEALLLCNRGGFVPKVAVQDPDVENVLFMVSAALGIAIMPEFTVRNYSAAKNLKLIPIVKSDGTPEMMEFCAAWRTDNENPAVEKLLDWVEVSRKEPEA